MELSKLNLTDLLRDFPALFNHNVDLTALKSELISQAELNVIRDNIILNAFRFAILDGEAAPLNYEHFSLDEYETEEKIDTVNSINQFYNEVGNYYRPILPGAGYSYRRQITIDHLKVEAAHQNFPMLVSVIDANLKTVGNGGKVENPNGYDIVFTSDVAGASQLDYEMEKYDGVNGELVAWVRIPDFTGYTKTDAEDLDIYLFYGNPDITESQENATAVWDSNFKMVQHLKDDPDNAHTKDSSINANNGTKKGANEPQEVDGAIGKEQNFDGINDYVDYGDDTTLRLTETGTVGGWMKLNAINRNQTVIAKGRIAIVDQVYAIFIWSDNTIGLYIGNGITATAARSINTLSVDTKYYVVGIMDGTNLILYVNGSVWATVPQTYNIDTAGNPLHIGSAETNEYPFAGSIDEVRISNMARSLEWTQTNYNNQSEPATFFSIAAEEVITGYSNMTLISKNVVADFEPSEVRKVIRIEPMEAITLNTDLKVWVTKEGADLETATWEQVIMESMGEFGSLKTVIKGTKSLAVTGTKDMRYKIETPTGKNIRIHGDAFQLKE